MQYNTQNTVFGDTSEIPSGVYVVRITDMSRKKSSKGNDMIVTTGEIVDPPTVQVGDKIVQVAGRRLQPWYVVLNPAESWGTGRLIEGLQKADLLKLQNNPEGVLFDDGEDDPSKLKVFIGKEIRTFVTCRPKIPQRPPTAEEVTKGDTGYKDIVDENGKPYVLGFNLETGWDRVVGPGGNTNIPF